MKPRDTDPLCRSADGVFFRSSGTTPNSGKWEQTDPNGFMSTSGTCTNQYHIRMWSSLELYQLTGAHLYEFVLAPIHHDHVYFKINLCTIIHWKINPESEGYRYQHLESYSGWVSRITFWKKSQHPGCSGA